MVDFARCDNVKASVQMMEVCRRALPDHHSSSAQAVLVPATNANVTLAFNNQVTRFVVFTNEKEDVLQLYYSIII